MSNQVRRWEARVCWQRVPSNRDSAKHVYIVWILPQDLPNSAGGQEWRFNQRSSISREAAMDRLRHVMRTVCRMELVANMPKAVEVTP